MTTPIPPTTRLPREFFNRDALTVARGLLGMRLVRHYAPSSPHTNGAHNHRLSGIIVETEAYRQDDTACHAHRGKTASNAVMFGPPGFAYVYFVYGMHHMFNVVVEPEGCAAAVLVRALEPLEGIETIHTLRAQRTARGRKRGKPKERKEHRDPRFLTGGPARLTQALAIEKSSCNGVDLVEGEMVWVEQGAAIPDEQVACGPRIGIDYAAEHDRNAPWRLWVKGNQHVSR